jgi:hypothetical protein
LPVIPAQAGIQPFSSINPTIPIPFIFSIAYTKNTGVTIMSWRYEQTTGVLYRPSGSPFYTGYSGMDWAKNKPALQHVPYMGPIPRGRYQMTDWIATGHAAGQASFASIPWRVQQHLVEAGF